MMFEFSNLCKAIMAHSEWCVIVRDSHHHLRNNAPWALLLQAWEGEEERTGEPKRPKTPVLKV